MPHPRSQRDTTTQRQHTLPPHRHTIPNEQHWEENWVNSGLSTSQSNNLRLVQQKSNLNKNQ